MSNASGSPAPKPPLHRRPLLLVIAAVVLVVLVAGGAITWASLAGASRPHLADADAASRTPVAPAPASTAAAVPSPTATTPPAAPSATTTPKQVAPPVSKPPVTKPPVTKPVTPPAPAPVTPAISDLRAARTASCHVAGPSTSVPYGIVVTWSATNATRVSMKEVTETNTGVYATTISLPSNLQGPDNFEVSCNIEEVVFTLTVTYEVSGAPETSTMATTDVFAAY
jgi:hypothetical protein